MRKSPAHEALALDQQLCFQLYTASRLLTRAYRPLLDPLGLTYPQYLVMLVLWELAADEAAEPPSVAALGVRLRLDSGTLTPLLKRLEEIGYVTRTRDTRDERIVRITLTELGDALEDRALSVPFDLLCSTQADIPAVLALRDSLEAMVAAMEAAPETLAAFKP